MENAKENPLNYMIGAMMIVVGLFFIRKFNYLLFHSLVELFSIAIAGTLFLIMWNSKKFMENKVLVFISIGYLFVAMIDLLHTLSYQGMSIFKDYDFYANQLWIAARYMESLTLLVAFAWPERVNQMIHRVGTRGIIIIYFLITAVLLASIFVWKIFPVCFIANQGQTEFKIISEYIVCSILITGILLLWKNRKNFDEKTYKLLIAAMVFTIFQELSFTLYSDNFGILNMVGHYFKIISFYLMYRAIVKTGIEDPYNSIFRELTINEIKLKDAKNAAEAANNMKSRFLANMSHEIRTPLNSIIGFTNILYEEEKASEKREKLEIIKNAGSHLLNLINNILEFSKIEAGMIQIEQKRFSIRKLLENLKKMFMIQSQERRLSWEVYIDSSVPEIIVGDEHRIMQVLVNLTGNAFKFTEFGGVSIRVTYENGQLEIIVKDTGIGIPEDKQIVIFSAFEQADTSYARKYGGTGLGLSITQNLLDVMGGSIRYESTGTGSEFIVSLPAEAGEIELQDYIEPVLAGTEPNSTERVIFLIVDSSKPIDMEVVQNIVKRGSCDEVAIKVLPFDSKTKDSMMIGRADIVLLYENTGSNTMKLLADDLKQDFRTTFVPVIRLKKCRSDRISFQADANALKYGKPDQEDDFYSFIRQVMQGREAFGTAMVERWLSKAEEEMGTPEMLLECLNRIVIRIEDLENALVEQVIEKAQSLTHSLKGSAGTLQMSEVYLKSAEIEAELRKNPPDMEKVRKRFSEVKELLGLIPKAYFDMKQLHIEKQKQALGKLRILVVDDNVENRKLIAYFLNRMNLNYQEAENGEAALKLLHEESFHVVLLDSQMPVMDGMTILKLIREDPALKGIHVIMQTATTFREDIREFFRAGCDDYISKPINFGTLQGKLEKFITWHESKKMQTTVPKDFL